MSLSQRPLAGWRINTIRQCRTNNTTTDRLPIIVPTAPRMPYISYHPPAPDPHRCISVTEHVNRSTQSLSQFPCPDPSLSQTTLYISLLFRAQTSPAATVPGPTAIQSPTPTPPPWLHPPLPLLRLRLAHQARSCRPPRARLPAASRRTSWKPCRKPSKP